MTLRRFFGLVLLVVSFNFLFLANSDGHTTIGFIWLAVAALALWDDIVKFKFIR